jgi:hypothetical protein
MPRQVALIGKSGGKGYLRQRQLGVAEHPLNLLQASIQKITVRWHSDGLVERASEMMRGQPGQRSQIVETDFLLQVGVDVLADPLCQCWRQPPTAGRRRLIDWQMTQGIDARLAVDNRLGPTARNSRFGQGRG